MARFEVRANNELEGWDVIDTQSWTNEGGECRDVPENVWLMTIYDGSIVELIVGVLNALSEGKEITKGI